VIGATSSLQRDAGARSSKETDILKSFLHGAAAATLLLGAVAALAHHSPAVFDRSQQITISGVVKEFRWGNPHSWIHLDVAAEEGRTGTWSVEMDPASLLGRNGWTARTIQPGDEVEVKIYPLRNDEKGGQYISIKLPNGKSMDEGRARPEVVRP
jgi:hypothetical protein